MGLPSSSTGYLAAILPANTSRAIASGSAGLVARHSGLSCKSASHCYAAR